MSALEFSITLDIINNIDWPKSLNRIMLEGYYQESSVDWPIHLVSLLKVLYLRRGHFITNARNYPINQNQDCTRL